MDRYKVTIRSRNRTIREWISIVNAKDHSQVVAAAGRVADANRQPLRDGDRVTVHAENGSVAVREFTV